MNDFEKDNSTNKLPWWRSLPEIEHGLYIEQRTGNIYDYKGNQVGFRDPLDVYRSPSERLSWGPGTDKPWGPLPPTHG